MAKSYISVIRHYNAAPQHVRDFFPEFEELVEGYSTNWEVPISYVFSRLEQAKRRTIYCGIVKLHWCESSLTWALVNKDHLSRQRFLDLFKVVFGKHIPKNLVEKLKQGESVRDKIVHGMEWLPSEAREALVSVIDFATEFDQFVADQAEFRPFGDLRGYKGRKQPLTPATTRWVLKGMGIPKGEQN